MLNFVLLKPASAQSIARSETITHTPTFAAPCSILEYPCGLGGIKLSLRFGKVLCLRFPVLVSEMMVYAIRRSLRLTKCRRKE